MISANFVGMKEVMESLKQLPEKLQKNVLVDATKEMGAEIALQARANVPVGNGILRDAIGLSRRKTRTKSLISFTISPRKDVLIKGFKALDIEKIKRISKTTGFEYTTWDNYGGWVEYGTSKSPASPYLTPAYELKGENSINVFTEYVAQRIDKEIEKARK
jgi:HK97 gp10 family phage protein